MRRSRFTVTTFNLYNLNRPGLRMYRDAEGLTQAQYDKKIAWTASMLRRARADLFGFQELWHPEALEEAVDRAGLADTHVVLAPPGLSGTRIHCAAAVDRDLLDGEPTWITDFPDGLLLRSRGDDPQTAAISVQIDRFSRPVLHLRLRPRADAKAVEVYVCHLKSKFPTFVYREPWFVADDERYRPHAGAIGDALSTIRRTAEAAALRVILNDQMRHTETPVIVLGDLNDDHNSNTLNILTRQPRILRPLSTGGSDTGLYSGQALQQHMSQRDVYYTYVHQGVHTSLDHILVSEAFYAASRRRKWNFEGLDIYNDHLNQEDHREEEGAGDHGVVRAHFRYSVAR